MFINSDRVDLRAEVFSPSATTADNYDFRRFAEQVLLIVESCEANPESAELFQDQISKHVAIYAAEALRDTLLQRYPDGPVQDSIVTFSTYLEGCKIEVEGLSHVIAVGQLSMLEDYGSGICEAVADKWQARVDAGLGPSTHADSHILSLGTFFKEVWDFSEPLEQVRSLLAVMQQTCDFKSCEACSNIVCVLNEVERTFELAFRPEGSLSLYLAATNALHDIVNARLEECGLPSNVADSGGQTRIPVDHDSLYERYGNPAPSISNISLKTISPPAGLSWGMGLSQAKGVLPVPIYEYEGIYDSQIYYTTYKDKEHRADLNQHFNTGISGLEVYEVMLFFAKIDSTLVGVSVKMVVCEASAIYTFRDLVLETRYAGAYREDLSYTYSSINYTAADGTSLFNMTATYVKTQESVLQSDCISDEGLLVSYKHPRISSLEAREEEIRDSTQKANAADSDF